MEIGTVGVALGLAARQDFDAVFSQMKAAGMTLFVPISIFEEWPEPQGRGYGTTFFPPPSGTADDASYSAVRAHGMKLIVPGSLAIRSATPSPRRSTTFCSRWSRRPEAI